MKKHFSLFTAAICLSGLFSPLFSGHPHSSPIDVQVGLDGYYDDDRYQVWAGPGWYYGHWFEDRYEYQHWLEYRFNDYNWNGPGWYYGIWFDDRNDFDYFRHNHRYYGRGHWRGRGDPNLHRHKNQGKWKGHHDGGKKK